MGIQSSDFVHDAKRAVDTINQERQAAEALRTALEKMPGMDEETVRDMIEGETNLFGAIERAAGMITERQIMQAGLKAKIAEFEGRLKRYSDGIDYLRAAVEQAMVIANLKTHEMSDCTLTLAHRAAGLVIKEEHLIPAEFWKAQDPTLDKRALTAALKEGRKIEGAILGNGGVSLTIRRA